MQIKVLVTLCFFFTSLTSFCQDVKEYNDFIPYYFEHKDLNKIEKVIISKAYADSIIDTQRDSLAYLGDNWGGVLLDTAFNLMEVGYKLKKRGKTYFYLRIFAEDALAITINFDKQSFMNANYVAVIWDVSSSNLDTWDYFSINDVSKSKIDKIEDNNIYLGANGNDVVIEYCISGRIPKKQEIIINGLYYYFK
jgi:hypothetical protein